MPRQMPRPNFAPGIFGRLRLLCAIRPPNTRSTPCPVGSAPQPGVAHLKWHFARQKCATRSSGGRKQRSLQKRSQKRLRDHSRRRLQNQSGRPLARTSGKVSSRFPFEKSLKNVAYLCSRQRYALQICGAIFSESRPKALGKKPSKGLRKTSSKGPRDLSAF